MNAEDPHFSICLAVEEQDLKAAHRLRYEVFVAELGGDGPLVDHEARIERDELDPFYDHMILIDRRRDPANLDHVVGAYRLLTGSRAEEAGRFYCDSEYDLAPLRESGRSLLELGRSCVHADYRGSTAMFYLWNGLADYVLSNGIEVLFGVASFHGTDVAALREPLAYLHHNHLAPEDMRVKARGAHAQAMDLMPKSEVDRKSAMRSIPAIIKAYLRLGGFVGEGAYVDTAFNTVDVCVLMDTERMSVKHREFYERSREAVV